MVGPWLQTSEKTSTKHFINKGPAANFPSEAPSSLSKRLHGPGNPLSLWYRLSL